jgi:TP901 family phage tail tape measure protein
MATELPGIKARAEFDLALFKQQEDQIKASLRAVSQAMREVPSARIQFDTKTGASASDAIERVRTASERLRNEQEVNARQTATTAERLARQAADARIREAKRASDEINKQLRAEAAAVERSVQQSNAAMAQAFDRRIQAAVRTSQVEERERTRAAQQANTALERAQRSAEESSRRSEQRRTQDAAREFDRRLQAATAARRAEEQESARLERARSTQERRDARLELPLGLALGAGGAAIALQLRDATGAAADFEKAMSQVRAVLSADEWARTGAQITQLARDLGASGLGFSATQSAAALEAMSKAGISATDQLKGAPAVLALAAAGNLEVANAANIAASAIQTFGRSGADLEAISNVLVGVANATIADVDQMRQSLQQSAAVAALQGRSFESLAVSIGLLSQAGIRSSDAGTALRTMMLRLTPDTARATETMQAFGIILNGQNRFIDATTGSFKDLREVAQVLQETLGHLSKAEQDAALSAIFGQDAYRAAAVLLRAGAAGYDELTAAATGNASAIEVARIRLDNLRGDLTNLNAAWENARITFGQAIEPNLRPLAQQLTAVLTAARDITPQMVTTAVVVGGALAAFLTLTGGLIALNAVFVITGALLGGIGTVLLTIAAPVAVVVAAVTALGIAWVNNWNDIQGKTQEAGKTIGTVLSELGANTDALASVIGNAKDNIVAAFQAIIDDEITQTLINEGRKLAQGFGQAFIDTLLEILGPLAEGLLIASGLKAVQVAIGQIKNRVDQEREALKSKRQSDAQARLTPTMQESDQQRIAESAFAGLDEALKTRWIEGFKNAYSAIAQEGVPPEVAQKLMSDLAEALKVNFANETPEIQDRILDIFRLSAQDQVIAEAAAVGEQIAVNYADKWDLAAKKIRESANDIGRALSMAGNDTELIKVLLQLGDAADATDKGMNKLADKGLSAALIAQRNLALDMTDGAEKTRALIAVGEQYDAHLAAQAKSAQDAAEWQKHLNDISAIGPKVTEERLRSLIEITYPALTVEQEAHVKRLLAEGKAYKAYQFAIVASGGTLEDYNDIVGRTGAEAAEAQKELKRFIELTDPNREFNLGQDQAQKLFDTIVSQTPTAIRAYLEFVSAMEGPVDGLSELWESLGLDISKIPDIANASAREIQEIQKQLQARIFLVETGQLLPASKMQTAGEQFRKASDDARKNLEQAQQQIRDTLDKARKSWREGVDAAAKELASARTKFAENIAKIRSDLANELEQIAAARAAATRKLNDQLTQISQREGEVVAESQRAAAESARTNVEQMRDRFEQFRQQTEAASRQIGSTIFQAVEQQRDQLRQLSEQLSDLRSREVEDVRNTAIRIEDIALKEFTARTHEEQQAIVRERIRLQAEQGAAAVALQKEITRGQADLHKQLTAGEQALIAQVAALRTQQFEAQKAFEKESQRAAEAAVRAEQTAKENTDRQLDALAKQRRDAFAEHTARMLELRKQEEDAKKRAEEEEKRAQKELDEAERVNQAQLQKLQDQLDNDELLFNREMNSAQDKFNEQMAVATDQLNEARKMAGLMPVLTDGVTAMNGKMDDLIEKWRPIEIDMSNMNVEEGDVEFLERAADGAEELAAAPIG